MGQPSRKSLISGRQSFAPMPLCCLPSPSSNQSSTPSPNPTQYGPQLVTTPTKLRRLAVKPGWSPEVFGHAGCPGTGQVICHRNSKPGTLTHIILECEDLSLARQSVYALWADYLRNKPYLFLIVRRYTLECSDIERMQFILDCTILPDVIALYQWLGKMVHDSLFYLTRSLCYSIEKTRSKLLGRWDVLQWWMILWCE